MRTSALLAALLLAACSSGGGGGPRPPSTPPPPTAEVPLTTIHGTATLAVSEGCSVDLQRVRARLMDGVDAVVAAQGERAYAYLRINGLRIVVGPPDRLICADSSPPRWVTYEEALRCRHPASGTIESDARRGATIYAVCDYTSRQSGERVTYASPGLVDHELGHLACGWLRLPCDCALVGHRPGFDLACRRVE